MKKIIILFYILLITTPAISASAPGIGISQKYLAQYRITNIGEFIGALIQLVFLISGLLVFINLVVGGFQWIISGGDKSKTQAARDRITATLVGISIIALSYAAMQYIGYFFGLENVVVGQAAIPLPF